MASAWTIGPTRRLRISRVEREETLRFVQETVRWRLSSRVGVDPVSWTPPDLGRRKRCRGADHRIRRSTGSRWSTWCVGGRTPESLSREFEPTAQSIWNWVRQAERDEDTRTDGLTTEEKEELRRLRHTTLELECIDRMYLNVYVPISQTGAGTAHFFKKERRPGHTGRATRGHPCTAAPSRSPPGPGAEGRPTPERTRDLAHFGQVP